MLTRHEFIHDLFNIVVTGARFNLLVCVFSLTVGLHLTVHLLLIELGPHFLHVPVFTEFDLVLVFRFVLGFFTDLVLPHLSFIAFLDSFFLILDRDVERKNPFLPFFLIHVERVH